MVAQLREGMDAAMEEQGGSAAADFNAPGNIVYYENVKRVGLYQRSAVQDHCMQGKGTEGLKPRILFLVHITPPFIINEDAQQGTFNSLLQELS